MELFTYLPVQFDDEQRAVLRARTAGEVKTYDNVYFINVLFDEQWSL